MSFNNGLSSQLISQNYNFDLLEVGSPTLSPSFPNNSYLQPEPDINGGNIVITLGVLSVVLTFLFFCCRRSALDSRSDSNNYGLAYYDYEALPELSPRSERAVVLHSALSTSLESEIASKVLAILWSDIKAYSLDPKDTIIGKGSFGVVFRGILQTHNGNEDIVVKVIKQTGRADGDSSLIRTAFEECRIIKEAESKMVYKSCIVKVYGIANGNLPSDCANVMNIQSAIGIVMRYEGGGTLTKRIHPTPEMIQSYVLDINEKIRLITGLARGLVELHSAGIVHGDIKPDNVLLSSDDPPEVRLADFGLARIREEFDMGLSSLHETKHTQGTLLYCAPEMMMNPFIDEATAAAVVAKASRKSDMYAFAVVSWEILTGLKPFGEVRLETTLAMKVHQGERPPISKIPSNCPHKVIEMIELCWSRDRFMRESAVKCFSKLQYEYRQLTNTSADICLSYHRSNQASCEYYYQRLTQLGCKVCILEKDNQTHENMALLTNSQIVIVFLNVAYQSDASCMDELKRARQLNNPQKVVVAVFTEGNYKEWADLEIYYLCQLRSQTQRIWDISDVVVEADTTRNMGSVDNDSSGNGLSSSNNSGETDEETVASSYSSYNNYIDDIKAFIDEMLKIKRQKQIEKFDLKKQTKQSSEAAENHHVLNMNDMFPVNPVVNNLETSYIPDSENQFQSGSTRSPISTNFLFVDVNNIHNHYTNHNCDEKMDSPVRMHSPANVVFRNSMETTKDNNISRPSNIERYSSSNRSSWGVSSRIIDLSSSTSTLAARTESKDEYV